MRSRDARYFLWPTGVPEKLESKHGVTEDEVEEAFFAQFAKVRRQRAARHYLLSQTDSGRYLIVWFDWSPPDTAIIVSARDMTTKERRLFRRK